MEHLILIGPPGAGKTLFARNLARTPAAFKHARACEAESSSLRRIAGLPEPSITSDSYVPFRAPHHTVSALGMTGQLACGYLVRPGELSLAHGGVLFLDRAPDFFQQPLRDVLSALVRGYVDLHGSQGTVVRLPAEFRLVISASRCYCDSRPDCHCTTAQKQRYLEPLAPFREHCRVLEGDDLQAEVQGALS